ncbi:MAG: hypothetical protein AABY22_06920 [Nanoarchaeota archaeon]
MTKILCSNGKKLTKEDLKVIEEFEEYRRDRKKKYCLNPKHYEYGNHDICPKWHKKKSEFIN